MQGQYAKAQKCAIKTSVSCTLSSAHRKQKSCPRTKYAFLQGMSQLQLSHMSHRERGVRGVSSVVCYAVLRPLSGGLCGLLCRVMPWSGACV